MTTTILDVNAIATDADLLDEAGEILDHAKKPGWSSWLADRTAALDDVLDALRNRTPRVYDTDLVDPTELKRAVVFRALERIFERAITGEGDVWHVRARSMGRRYATAVSALAPTVQDGVVAPGGLSIGIFRR